MREEKKRRQKEGVEKRTGMAEAEKALTQLFGDNDQAKQLLQRAESEKRKEMFRRDSKQKDAPEAEIEEIGLDALSDKLKSPALSKKSMFFENMFSVEYLCEYIDNDDTKRVTRAPKAVESIIKCIHGLSPNLKRGCNDIARGIDNEAKARWFRQTFPPGTIIFKVPRQHATAKPHLVYSAAEDVKIVFVRWELQSDDKLMCPLCKNGELIHGRFGIKRNSVHPILDGKFVSESVTSTPTNICIHSQAIIHRCNSRRESHVVDGNALQLRRM